MKQQKNYQKPRTHFTKHLLPTPTEYYSKQFDGINQKTQWIRVHCCFHPDSNPSLSLNLISGGFYCFGCGVKGGDVISFVMQRDYLTFKQACQQLGAWI